MTTFDPQTEAPMETTTRLGSFTTLWRCTVRHRDRTPPFDTHPPVEVRALSEAMAGDLLAQWRPDLEVLAVERRRTE